MFIFAAKLGILNWESMGTDSLLDQPQASSGH